MIGKTLFAATAACVIAGPLAAQSDVPGSRAYFLSCRPCHSVTDPDGEVLMLGSGMGSDLYGIIDRPAARDAEFAYSEALRRAGAEGLIWTEDNITAYAADPKGFLRDYLDDPRAEVDMEYSFSENLDQIVAYLRAVAGQTE